MECSTSGGQFRIPDGIWFFIRFHASANSSTGTLIEARMKDALELTLTRSRCLGFIRHKRTLCLLVFFLLEVTLPIFMVTSRCHGILKFIFSCFILGQGIVFHLMSSEGTKHVSVGGLPLHGRSLALRGKFSKTILMRSV